MKIFFKYLMLVLGFVSQLALAEKASIAIGEIEYRAQESSETRKLKAYGARQVQEETRAFIDMVSTALVKTNKLRVIERDRLDVLMQERGLSMARIISGGATGQLKGVDYILTGSITQLGYSETANSFGNFASASKSASMSVDLKVVNAHTGEIGLAETVQVSHSGGVAIQVKDNVFGSAGDKNQLLGAVMRKSANNATALIVTSIYPIKIVNVGSDGTIVLNYGNSLLEKGDILDVFSVGEEFIDLDTGETLGNEEVFVTKIKVSSSTSKFSKAVSHQESEFQGTIEKGMIARTVKGGAKNKVPSGINIGGVKLF